MSAEKHVATLKEAYREWEQSGGENADCWLSILDDNVALRSLSEGRPGMEFTRRRQSKAEVAAYLTGLTTDWRMNYFKVNEFVAQGDRVVAVGSCSWNNRRTGKSVDTPIVHLWRFKNGKATEYFEFYDTAAVQAAAL
ncbi:MAG: nuclear transport factor 2 family protein [Alphaproteobacteria bacterium]